MLGQVLVLYAREQIGENTLGICWLVLWSPGVMNIHLFIIKVLDIGQAVE